MITLVNSKGETLNEAITVSEVKKYDGLLTRGNVDTGLWEVTVKLNNYVEDAFKSIAEDEDGNDILYAVHVNSGFSTEKARNVTSNYDLALGFKASLLTTNSFAL